MTIVHYVDVLKFVMYLLQGNIFVCEKLRISAANPD